jgi:DNA-binding CsgD family transcriptional regulator
MNQDETLQEISNKLSAVLLVLLSPEPAKQNTAAKVELLARTGISNQEIATILGTTKGTVEVLKSRSNRKRK